MLARKVDLRERQLKILDLWTRKKQQLDRCQQSVLLEATAKQVCFTGIQALLEVFAISLSTV